MFYCAFIVYPNILFILYCLKGDETMYVEEHVSLIPSQRIITETIQVFLPLHIDE